MHHPKPAFNNDHLIKTPAVYKIGGRSFPTRELARLSGAPDGTAFSFNEHPGTITMTGKHAQFFEADKPMERLLVDTGDGLMLFNVQFYMKPEYRRDGLGFKMLNKQLEACRELRIPSIACLAGRWGKDEAGKRTALDGYIVWPKLGFDGPIPAAVADKLGEKFSTHNTIQQLIQAEGGLAAWHLHGDGCRLTFEVDSRSVHSQVFMAYGRRKGFLP